MTPLTKLTDDLFCIEVEADAQKPEVHTNFNPNILDYWKPVGHSLEAVSIQLPSGNWQYIGYATKDEISFDVWRKKQLITTINFKV